MTEKTSTTTYGDALTRPFWEAAQQGRLIIQRCAGCGTHEFYPRPFCLSCGSDALEWVDAKGTGEIYSVTTVRMNVLPELPPPYQVAIIQLEEGPRMLAGVVGGAAEIGDRFAIRWREREGLPPLPMIEVSVPSPPTPLPPRERGDTTRRDR